MYKHHVTFLVCIFIFTILIQCVDRNIEEFFIKKSFKKAGKGLKKFAHSKAGIATFSVMAGLACGPAAPACAAILVPAVAGGLIASKNKEAKKKYKRDKINEGKRRTRVLTNRQNRHSNGNSVIDGYEASNNPCNDYRVNGCSTNNNDKCHALKKQCNLSRSVTYIDSHYIDIGKSNQVERSRI